MLMADGRNDFGDAFFCGWLRRNSSGGCCCMHHEKGRSDVFLVPRYSVQACHTNGEATPSCRWGSALKPADMYDAVHL